VLKECVKRMNRQALHALRLGFNHPRTGERVQFVSPIPQDMREVLEWLRSQKPQTFPSSLTGEFPSSIPSPFDGGGRGWG
jgi:hypothetical protein